MFSFLKKQKKEIAEEKDKISGKDEEKEMMDKRMGEEIVIHTMPEKFRQDSLKTDKAKQTGIFVMVGGFIFIVVIGFLLYLFIFKAPAEKQVAPIPQQNETYTPEPLSNEEVETSTPSEEVLPIVTQEEYLGGPEESGASTTPEETEVLATSTPAEEIFLGDRDGDGLTNKEETLLGTDDGNVDSDADGYSDYEEIMNLYNPVGSGKLADNPNIGEYINGTFGYKVLYPANWPRTSVGGDDSIMFKSEDNQFIQLIVQPNTDKQSIEDWYVQQFAVETTELGPEVSGNGWSGIKSTDGLIVYLTDSNRNYLFVLSYNAGSSETLDYINIFAAMIKSLVIGD
ncbi:MAG: hypothetical protein PHZ04_04270 [Patescibacteria group bacterium]|nr:hypothetical protein [Patescibacteria group bacterium]